MIWIYGLGLSFIQGAYIDIMRSKGSARTLNLIFELLASISWLIFFIWGFFVFEWWVPFVMPIFGMIFATFITIKVINIPHLLFPVGAGLCLYSILNY